jgi:hypothetical protein
MVFSREIGQIFPSLLGKAIGSGDWTDPQEVTFRIILELLIFAFSLYL